MNQSIEIGIIGAMKIEIEALCAAMEDATVEMVGGIAFTVGSLRGHRVVAAVCGVGKVFAAMCAQTMILTYAPAVVINTGVAGTLTDRLSIGQVALADRLVQHDMDTSAVGDPVGMISGINVIYLPTDPAVTDALAACVAAEGVPALRGTIASGDQFVHTAAQKQRISSTFENTIACEMEGAAIGHVCFVNHTPCAILRAISDGGNEQVNMDYPTFLAKAAATATAVMLRFVETW